MAPLQGVLHAGPGAFPHIFLPVKTGKVSGRTTTPRTRVIFAGEFVSKRKHFSRTEARAESGHKRA